MPCAAEAVVLRGIIPPMLFVLHPKHYDIAGEPCSSHALRRSNLFHHVHIPLRHFATCPLRIKVRSVEEIISFLNTCTYISDLEHFALEDYWLSPDAFEHVQKGDCEDFALWAWRQLLHLGYRPRLVIGVHREHKTGHAWVTFEREGRHFLFETTALGHGKQLPRIHIFNYHPKFSIGWDGQHFQYYRHREEEHLPTFRESVDLLNDWLYLHTANRFVIRLVRFFAIPLYGLLTLVLGTQYAFHHLRAFVRG